MLSAFSTIVKAQTFRLVKDINQQKSSTPTNWVNGKNSYAALNGKAYFAANDGVHGIELWSTDGTTTGTSIVKDINPGAIGSQVKYIYTFKSKVYFFATANGKYLQFWSSDGTAAGTTLLKDSFNLSNTNYPVLYATLGDELLFTITKVGEADELWKTNGTHVEKIFDVTSISTTLPNVIRDLSVLNNRLFFTIGFGSDIYSTDGTKAGTTIFNFDKHGQQGVYSNFIVDKNYLFFFYSGSIWQTSGDSASTKQVSGQQVNNYGRMKGVTYALTADNNFPIDIYLSTIDSVAPYNIHTIKKLNVGNQIYIVPFMPLNDSILFFMANTETMTARLWVSDGTEEGTKVLVDNKRDIKNLFIWNKKLYFSHASDNEGEELWVTDGTIAGTKMLKDINPGIYGSFPQAFSQSGSSLLFTAGNNTNGVELWQSNGTDSGTTLLKDINTVSTSSAVPTEYNYFRDTINNRLLLAANDGINGSEMWSSDGTSSGTYLLKDIVPGSGSGFTDYTYSLTARQNNDMYFFAHSDTNQLALWKTQGLNNTTTFVSNFFHIDGGIDADAIGSANSNIFALVRPSTYSQDYSLQTQDSFGHRLYVYSGSGQPKILKRGFFSAFSQVNKYKLPVAGNSVLFFLYPGVEPSHTGMELWKSDGTEAGTQVVKNLFPGQYARSATIGYSAQLKGQAFFVANSGSNWNPTGPTPFDDNFSYLWKSDGSEAGTQVVKKINVYLYSPLTVVDNQLYFVANDGVTGNELWVTDGTEAGTHIVKNITPGSGDSYIYGFAGLNGWLYFNVYDGVNETLWKTNGTEQNTHLITLNGGQPVAGNDKIYFIYKDEVWQSDGRPVGTVSMGKKGIEGVQDLQQLRYAGDRLYFWGTSNEYGAELYTTTYLLPVTLLDFTAQLNNNDALLQWATVNEQHNSHFNVQRSINGTSFTTIARVDAKNGVKKNDYDYTDAGVTALGTDKLYYRLQQFDADGKFTYSKTIPLTINNNTLVTIGPNPAIDVANIYSTVNMPGAVVTVTDMSGRVLYTAKQNIIAGSKTSIPLRGFAKGVYTVTIQGIDTPKQEFKLVVGK